MFMNLQPTFLKWILFSCDNVTYMIYINDIIYLKNYSVSD